MPREKLGLLDNAYLKACNLFLDYGGLALSFAGGAACADYDSAYLGENARGLLIGGGFLSIGLAPGIDSIIGSGKRMKCDLSKPGDDIYFNQYIGSQVGRNLFAYFGAWQLGEGIRSGLVPNLFLGIFAFGLAVTGQVLGRSAKKELEDRIRGEELLE